MDSETRRKMEMAGRARDFSRTNPSDSPGHAAAVARLEERLARAEALVQDEKAGRLAAGAAIAERDALRESIDADLRLLAGIARSAGVEATGVPFIIRYPGPRRGATQYVNDARVAATTAAAQEDLLVRYGLPPLHLPDLSTSLDRLDRFLTIQGASVRRHVAARAELKAVGRDLTRVVRQLDSINRHRFRSDPASLAAWRSARDPRRPRPRTASAPATGGPPSPAPADLAKEAKPAA